MISVRGGSGLGDAIYAQGVVRELVKNFRVEMCTDWPDVFRYFNGRLKLSPFRKKPIDRLAHYSMRRTCKTTSQFEDCCIQAGLRGAVEFKLDWKPVHVSLVERLQKEKRPVVVVQMPRAPFGRADGFGMEFLPDCRRIQEAINLIRDDVFLVEVGKGKALFNFTGIHLDLRNQTSVSDLIDIAFAAAGGIGYCSFIIPLMECFGKPVQLVWSRAGLNSPQEIIRLMTPNKMLLLPTSRAVVDDCSSETLKWEFNAFLDAVGSQALV